MFRNQIISSDADATVELDCRSVILATDCSASRAIMMPPARGGCYLKVFWAVDQSTSDRVFTCVGEDTMVGNIHTVFTNGCTVVGVTSSTTTITCVDDVKTGSSLEFNCITDGLWVVGGNLFIDAIGSTPTIN